MKWRKMTVTLKTDPAAAQLVLELVSDVFYSLGVSGVEIETPAPSPQDHRQQQAVSAYFYEDGQVDSKIGDLSRRIDRLADKQDLEAVVNWEIMDDEDWAEAWKAHFYPEKVGRAIVVKPTWREYAPAPGETVIALDPGMAFGTGTHPTTRMCLQLVEAHIRPADRLLDVGTGSGLLMIAAWKMGAGQVTGLDNDPVAIAVARDNLELNQVPPPAFALQAATGVRSIKGPFECIVANILTEVIVALVPDIPALLVPGGCFICSGIIAAKAEQVQAALQESGLVVKEKRIDQEWVCFLSVSPLAPG